MVTTVFVVDDDAAVRESLAYLLESSRLRCVPFASAEEFIESGRWTEPGCVLLDLAMPGLNGLSVQRVLAERGAEIPIVFLTGHGDVPAAVQAMRGGAFDFLEKPFDSDILLTRVRSAISLDARRRAERDERDAMLARVEQLTPREREVMELVVQGLLNKQIAARLGLSEKTVEIHRGRVMRKMRAGTAQELVRMAITAFGENAAASSRG